MKQAAAPATPEQWLAAIDEPKRTDLRRLHDLVRRTVPDLAPVVVGGMLGFGPFHYRYASGHEGDTALVCIASTKAGISVYVCAADEKGYLVEQAAPRLGKASVGKGCIRFRKLDDLDVEALASVLVRARELGGTGAVTTTR